MSDREQARTWLNHVIGTDSNRAAAEKAGIEQSSLHHRRKRDNITAEDVIAIARAYNKPVVASLAETGFITTAESFESNIRAKLSDATDENLSKEILRRLQNGQAGPHLTDTPEAH